MSLALRSQCCLILLQRCLALFISEVLKASGVCVQILCLRSDRLCTSHAAEDQPILAGSKLTSRDAMKKGVAGRHQDAAKPNGRIYNAKDTVAHNQSRQPFPLMLHPLFAL